jgi:hypothetical protein
MPIVLFFSIGPVITGHGQLQHPDAWGDAVSAKAFREMESKYNSLSQQVTGSTEQVLQKMQRKEAALRRMMKDSGQASQLFGDAQKQYTDLLDRLKTSSERSALPPTQYFAAIDSVRTSMDFLAKGGLLTGMASGKWQKAAGLAQRTGQLQQQLQVAGEAQAFLRQREQQLKDGLQQYLSGKQLGSIGRQLTGVNKQVYYYQQQLSLYKSLLNDKGRLEETALSSIQQLPAFHQFWEKNSAIAQLFPQRKVDGVVQPPSGLQTRQDVQTAIAGHLNTNDQGGGQSALNLLQAQAGKAQGELSALKDRISSLGGTAGGSSDMTMPSFTPNSQHTKRFLDRLETGFSLQTGPASNFLPASLQPAVYLGYRINDGMTAGVGASYIMGLGQMFQHVRLSNQGVGLRSYADIRIKGGFWFTAGWEYNYYQAFADLQAIKDISAWRRSALAGLSKKYHIGKKEGKVQLLFDLLYAQELPKGQPLVYRVSYSF